ncbi:MAG: YqeG family HAD IIIA-type phosphatase [Oscillospiraceae bacterium]|nr:YqeG family HAD IIIA-type phosphatase [Oscillospiraceae bacterium]
MLYPNLYLNSITEITLEMLNKNNIKGLILDLDNTIIDFDRNLANGVKEWCENLKKSNIKICILSNTNKVDKVAKAAKELNLGYINFARKPLKSGFKKAKKLLQLETKNIAVVGDQIFTDIIGANRMRNVLDTC